MPKIVDRTKSHQGVIAALISKRPLLSYVVVYFTLVGVIFHLLVLGVWYFKPELIGVVKDKVISGLQTRAGRYSLDVALGATPIRLKAGDMPLAPWKPLPVAGLQAAEIRIGSNSYHSLSEAAAALRTGNTLAVGPGLYSEAFAINVDGVTLVSQDRVVLDAQTTQGKAAIVIKGDDTTVRNIECRNIKVADGNGACIRQEGRNLNVEHVHFHDSQQGILTGLEPGYVHISDSRFEQLGNRGQAHGVYIGGGHLLIEGSQFLRGKDGGHEIKSRSLSTRITRTFIAALDGDDSRLIDLPHGGDITIERSVLQHGPNSVNSNLIGVGLEGRPYDKQNIVVQDNYINMERAEGNVLLNTARASPKASFLRNIVVSADDPRLGGDNIYFESRAIAGLGPFPQLPKLWQ